MINNRADFYQKIVQESSFDSEVFDLPGHKLTVQTLHSEWIIFDHCTFNCDVLEFKNIKNPELVLEFRNCTFNCELNFSNSAFERLTLEGIRAIKSLDIRKGLSEHAVLELNIFEFKYDYNSERPEINAEFYFSNIQKNRIFKFENVNHLGGKFQFIENDSGIDKSQTSHVYFENTHFSNAYFCRNHFNSLTSFYHCTFSSDSEYLKQRGAGYRNSKFYDNTFSKVDFSSCSFNQLTEFDKCDFLGTTWFENCGHSSHDIKFVACKFERYTLFDNSRFNKIEILHSKFIEKTSFENFEANHFRIHQVTFAEAAHFDDLNKNHESVIAAWDRKTLRAIKRELVNTHNQIDYLRFKAYELHAYKLESGKGWKDNFILFLGQKSNNFGLDWTKGVVFSVVTSFVIYLLYLIAFAISVKDSELSKYFPLTVEDFMVMYLKFINPFSFLKLPIDLSESYFFPLCLFIIGKILVSYGIYQTIQAFRKFGVNGG